MKKSVLISFAATAAFAACLLFVPQEASAQRPGGGGKAGAKQDETVYVIQVGDEYKKVKRSELTTEKKKVEDDYKQALKEWQDIRKSDPKAPRPVKPLIKQKGTFQTDIGAQEFIDKLKEDDEKKGIKPKTDAPTTGRPVRGGRNRD
jgi:hypothetical protein